MNKRTISASFLTLCLSISLTACASSQGLTSGSGGNLSRLSLPATWGTDVQVASSISDPADWLVRLNDTSLIALVIEAQSMSPDLQRLRARLDQAQALTRRAKAGLAPTLDVSFGGTRTDELGGSDRSTANLSAGLDVSWAPDLWRRTKASSDAVNLNALATRLDLEAGQKLLKANIAEAWFVAIEAKLLAEVAVENLAVLDRTLAFVTVQFERGLRSGQDIALIRADVASARASVERARASSRNARRALETLVGRYPNMDRDLPVTLPNLPALTIIGQPADLLNARPDLQAARLRVEAAMRNVDSAKASRLPELTLGGVIGGSSSQFGSVLDPVSLAASLFSGLSAPILDGGRRNADVHIAEAGVDEALADYRTIALDAFLDVERQLDEDKVLKSQEVALTESLSNAREALRFTQFRYELGENDLLNVLSIQQRVSFIEGRLVSVRRARLAQYIGLALATDH